MGVAITLALLALVAVANASPMQASTIGGKDYCNRGLKEYHCVRVNADKGVVCGVSTKHRRDRGCCRYGSSTTGQYQLSECSTTDGHRELSESDIRFDAASDTYRVKTGSMKRGVRMERDGGHCAAQCALELAQF